MTLLAELAWVAFTATGAGLVAYRGSFPRKIFAPHMTIRPRTSGASSGEYRQGTYRVIMCDRTVGSFVPPGYGASLPAHRDMPLGGSNDVERLRGGQGQVLAQTITILVDARPVQVGTDRAAARSGAHVDAVADSVLRW